MRHFKRLGATAVVLLLAVGCSSFEGQERATSDNASSTPVTRPVKVVALGDSDATGIGDSTGRGWVRRYGDLVHAKLDVPVAVDNQAYEGQTSEQLLTAITGVGSLRRTLSRADVILIGIGGADLNIGDEAWAEGLCSGRSCYKLLLARFGKNIAAIAHEVRQLAPTAALRAISLPNGVPGAGDAIPASAAPISLYQVQTERKLVCAAMQSSGGQCVDVVRAFNGDNGDGDAYAKGLMTTDPCCYPSANGQQLIAQLLVATGLEGLVGAG